MSDLKSLSLYCGHRTGDDPDFMRAATVLGQELAAENIRLIYGGGKLGLMGACASAARDNGGNVFGVIPEFLIELEGILEGVENKQVKTMHERKMIMFEQSDAICTMPGGIGTLEEIIEILSWARLDLHHKPIILLNTNNFWSPLVKLIDHIIGKGFATSALRSDINVVDTPEEVIPCAREMLASYQKKVC